MSAIREKLVYAANNRAYQLIDYNVHDTMQKRYEFKKQTLLSDDTLTEDEKAAAVRLITITHDRDKVINSQGTKRTCENCNQECFATLYCEHCVRNYLKANFSNWTSGNDEIDNLIQICQTKTVMPEKVIEWIPYDNFENVIYLTSGGCSEVYTAEWVGGQYEEWDSKKQQLKRIERPGIECLIQRVILKGLNNVENASMNWLDEAKSHLTLSNRRTGIAQCYGLTRNLSGRYMLVVTKLDMDLRKYLQQNHNKLTWKQRAGIVFKIVVNLNFIYGVNVTHKDLHSGNILYCEDNDSWYISDLGFTGPADKVSSSIYGNLPYIAPEVLAGKGYTVASDIYSVAMLMWEISSGHPPFINCRHDFDLAMNIIKGVRPKIVSGTPLEYQNIMKRCWDADPLKRPQVGALWDDIKKVFDQNDLNELSQPVTNNTSVKFPTSKIYEFENPPEPRNATEEEQEEFYSRSYEDLIVPDINDEDHGENESSN